VRVPNKKCKAGSFAFFKTKSFGFDERENEKASNEKYAGFGQDCEIEVA
jgi:hypothetical protein